MTQQLTVTKPKAQLVLIGARSVSTQGWRLDLVEEHLREHLAFAPRRQWCETSCMARTFWGRDTKANREHVRRRLSHAFREFLRRDMFVVLEYATGAGSHGEIIACKLFTATEEAEKLCAMTQLSRMQQRKQLSESMVLAARNILERP